MGKTVSRREVDAQRRLSEALDSLFRRVAAQCRLLGLDPEPFEAGAAELLAAPAVDAELPVRELPPPEIAASAQERPASVAGDVHEALAAMVEAMPHYMVGLDGNGRCILANPAFRQFLDDIGYECQGQAFDALILSSREREPVSLPSILSHAAATGMWDGDLVLGLSEGRRAVVHANFFHFGPFPQLEVEYAGILLDISQQKQIEADAIQYEVMRSIGMLAGGVAHNLNNLLVGVMGYASLLKPHVKSDAKMAKYVTMIESSSAKAAELTRQLLSFSQRGESKPTCFDINDAIKIAVSLVRKMIRADIEIDVAPSEEPALVHVDPAHMEHIILRLCVNAGDAMPKGGKLAIAARTEILTEDFVAKHPHAKAGPYVRLIVRDTGHGIPPDLLKDIFHPFFTTREFTHRGMGLSSAYGLVQRYKGIITVSSEVGEGTTFDVYLPLHEPPAENAQRDRDNGGAQEPSARLLIVDDEPMVLDFFASVLEHEPYELLFARNGLEALEIFKRDPRSIDLVFMDMIMPKRDGLETYQEMSRIRPDVKVIFSSGFTMDGNLSQLVANGDVSFLRKPFNIRQFLDMLHSAIG